MSIEFCQKIITPEWNEFFKEFSKKDDLADCLLQGYSFYTLLIEENNKNIKSRRNWCNADRHDLRFSRLCFE